MIGRLLSASTTEYVIGCSASQHSIPAFGSLVRVSLADGYEVFGLVYDILIEDDGLVRQLVAAERINEAIIADNRVNRNVPVEISVLAVGYRQKGKISHLLPPRPPLSLDAIDLCEEAELCQFTGAGHFGYFRHVLRAADLPVGELLAAHLQQARTAHTGAGHPEWVNAATQELITLLRDDYPTLMSVLGALGDVDVRSEG
jgi:hypothetical protein